MSRSSQLVLQASQDIFRCCKPWIFVWDNFRTNVLFQDLHSVIYANLLLLTTNWKMMFIVHYLFMFVFNWCIKNLFVKPSEVTLYVTKGENLHYVIRYNIIWANQKTESFVYCSLCPLAKFDVMCFPAFVGALDVILSVLSKWPSHLDPRPEYCIKPTVALPDPCCAHEGLLRTFSYHTNMARPESPMDSSTTVNHDHL